MINIGTALFNKRLDQVDKGVFKNKIIKYFPDTYMGYSHSTLKEIAFEHEINLNKLAPGEYVVFVNKSKTAAKLFASGNVYAYLRMPQGAEITDDIIRKVPKFFSGSEISTRTFSMAVAQ